MTISTTATGEYAGASGQAIQHHYDVGNEFWGHWLDSSLTYSCAMWAEGDTLDAAQRRKVDWLIDNARAASAGRVLDVGCGWGSFLRRAVERGAKHAVGITLSPKQAEWINGLGDPRLEVHVTGWADYSPDQPFDAIVSVGAFEHFARLGLTREEKVESYRDFVARCHEWLRPGGWMVLQTIAKGDTALDGQGLRDFAYIVTKMFPESDLPHPADVFAAMEGRFEVVQMRNDRWMYARTCQAWLERLDANREPAVAAVGEEIVDLYRRYLAACIRQFDRGHAGLTRYVLRRVEQREPFRFGGAG
ncbi:MAG TPA: class I SAM-dependent methyltransferase [Thermoleophilaceae bacterium]